ncbi:hypothetical protein KBH77_03025, partial [Patescibacteria group bacterium]|nr:hypothetical protein [Patescibacteria group bacterium]
MEKGNFNTDVSPTIDRMRKFTEFKEYLENGISELEYKLNKIDISNDFLDKEIMPLVNRISKIVSYINSANSVNIDISDIDKQALQNLFYSDQFRKLERKFYYLKNKKLPKIKQKIDKQKVIEDKKDPKNYWWGKLEE